MSHFIESSTSRSLFLYRIGRFQTIYIWICIQHPLIRRIIIFKSIQIQNLLPFTSLYFTSLHLKKLAYHNLITQIQLNKNMFLIFLLSLFTFASSKSHPRIPNVWSLGHSFGQPPLSPVSEQILTGFRITTVWMNSSTCTGLFSVQVAEQLNVCIPQDEGGSIKINGNMTTSGNYQFTTVSLTIHVLILSWRWVQWKLCSNAPTKWEC